MTAKEYLRQIRDLDRDAKSALAYYDRLKADEVTLRSPRYDTDKVQASGSGAGFTAQADKVVDAYLRAQKAWDEYIDTRDKIVAQINALNQPYRRILHMRFVEYDTYRRLDDIADEIAYSSKHTERLYRMALREFGMMWLG